MSSPPLFSPTKFISSPQGWAQASTSSRRPSWASFPVPHSVPYYFPAVDHCVPSPYWVPKLPEDGIRALDFFPAFMVPRPSPSGLFESLSLRPGWGSNTSFATWCCVTWANLLNLSEPPFFPSVHDDQNHSRCCGPSTQVHTSGDGVLLCDHFLSTTEDGTSEEGRVRMLIAPETASG